ncbi:MAG: DUF2027 domain-containing protein [Muribaculaceae bacterium]|nr:DUF2027 domain-containing protein [Muribaculaceae bacterium]
MKINDTVRFLNDVGGGKIVRLDGKTAYVEDQDGFERPVPTSELVVVQAGAPAHHHSYDRPLQVRSKLVEPDKPTMAPQPKPEPVVETPEGEVLNITLAFEPREIKHLNTTTFYSVLVNDSNYFLYITYASRADEDRGWTTQFHGIIEPNMQVNLNEFGHDDLNDITHIAVQYIAFKQGKQFALKNPALVTRRIDVTKFYKLHSFQSNEYFDNPVLAIDITRNDLPAKLLRIDSSALENSMRDRRAGRDNRQVSKPSQARQRRHDIVVQDLHIAELLDDTRGLSNSDMLRYQLDKFREVMNENRNNLGQKLVFIHGKGEGVLRKALLDELRRYWPQCEVQDASFQEYGFGATQVTIHRDERK